MLIATPGRIVEVVPFPIKSNGFIGVVPRANQAWPDVSRQVHLKGV